MLVQITLHQVGLDPQLRPVPFGTGLRRLLCGKAAPSRGAGVATNLIRGGPEGQSPSAQRRAGAAWRHSGSSPASHPRELLVLHSETIDFNAALSRIGILLDQLEIPECLRIGAHQIVHGVAVTANDPLHPLLGFPAHL